VFSSSILFRMVFFFVFGLGVCGWMWSFVAWWCGCSLNKMRLTDWLTGPPLMMLLLLCCVFVDWGLKDQSSIRSHHRHHPRSRPVCSFSLVFSRALHVSWHRHWQHCCRRWPQNLWRHDRNRPWPWLLLPPTPIEISNDREKEMY